MIHNVDGVAYEAFEPHTITYRHGEEPIVTMGKEVRNGFIVDLERTWTQAVAEGLFAPVDRPRLDELHFHRHADGTTTVNGEPIEGEVVVVNQFGHIRARWKGQIVDVAHMRCSWRVDERKP
jgi:hypothetical protein